MTSNVIENICLSLLFDGLGSSNKYIIICSLLFEGRL